jgi:hypothetical protein
MGLYSGIFGIVYTGMSVVNNVATAGNGHFEKLEKIL